VATLIGRVYQKKRKKVVTVKYAGKVIAEEKATVVIR
jgi:hypothetical protein